MSTTQQELRRAFRLIKNDEVNDALAIIQPIIQQEPDNVDAWWLLAYAETDPKRAREALLTVLRLDPNYANAAQARDMLDKLNQEYPPGADEIAQFPELQGAAAVAAADLDSDRLFSETDEHAPPFEELTPLESEPSFADAFEVEDLQLGTGEDDEELLMTVGSDPFAELDEDPFKGLSDERVAFDAEQPDFATMDDDPFDFDEFQLDESLDDTLDEPLPGEEPRQKGRKVTIHDEEVVLDNEALAALEERQGRRRSSRGFLYGVIGLLLLAGLVAVVTFGALQVLDDTGDGDLGDLEIIASESTVVEEAKVAAAQQLESANLGGEKRVVAASSPLGDTLFVEMCSRPSPDLPMLIKQTMMVAAAQAPRVKDVMPAVGISIDYCTAEGRDTLYRAAAPVNAALQYLGAQNTTDEENAWADFQSSWQMID